MDIQNKTALISGSGVRLGRAMALALAQKGCNLALHYNSSDAQVREVQAAARNCGVKAEIFQADLTNEKDIQKLIDEADSRFGFFDILINNAGVYLKGNGLDTTSEMLQQQFRLNLFAPILLTRGFASQLPKEAHGKVINISDAKVFRHEFDHFAYRLTKKSINEMTAMFALELAPRITVNAIAPGIMLPLAGKEHVDLQMLADKLVPLKKPGNPEMIAQAVLYLLEQDFITGTIIRLDGGQYL